MVAEWNLKEKKTSVKINIEIKMKMDTNLDWIGSLHLECLQSVQKPAILKVRLILLQGIT
jgi:hypothetical protein